MITDVRTTSVDTLNFPAVTFCMKKSWTNGGFESFELTDEILSYCSFDSQNKCKVDDFEKSLKWFSSENYRGKMNCYKFNSGNDAHGKQGKVIQTTRIGQFTGLRLIMNLKLNSSISYHIGDYQNWPSEVELNRIVLPETSQTIYIRKVVDEKLPKPYNPCLSKESIDLFDSELVKKILQNNKNYRQVNCYDMCFQMHLDSIAYSRNISHLIAYRNLSDFNRTEKCDNLCPLECDSIYYESTIEGQKITDQEYHKYLNNYLNDSDAYKKENLLIIRIQYDEMKFTHMSQTAKMTTTDLVSNIGGVLGVFLELSFFSIYKIIYFFLDRCISI